MIGLGLWMGGQRPAVAPPPFAPLNVHNTTVTPSGSGFIIQKTGGTDTLWGDASAADAVNALSGDFILRFTPAQANKDLMLGISVAPLTDDNYTSIDHALYFSSGGTVSLFASGSSSGTLAGTYLGNWFIKRTGSAISIGFGGTNGVTGYTELATITSASTYYFDSALNSMNAPSTVARLA